MLEWSSCPAVERDPRHLGGCLVLCGICVPASVLFENLEDGVQIAQFVEWFPGATVGQARKVLDHADKSLAVS